MMMKHWMQGLAMASMVVAAGCSSDAKTTSGDTIAEGRVTTAVDVGHEQGSPITKAETVAAKGGPASTSLPTESLDVIAISDAAVEQINGESKGERLWEITASIHNGGAVELPGVELVADLSTASEEHAFARNSAEVRFPVLLKPGSTFAWRSLSPVIGKPPQGEALVSVKATRRLETLAAVSDGWRPLDPATAVPKIVGKPVIVPAAKMATRGD